VDRLAIMDYLFVLLLNAIVRCNAAPTNANDLFSIIREILRCGSNSCPCTTEDVVLCDRLGIETTTEITVIEVLQPNVYTQPSEQLDWCRHP